MRWHFLSASCLALLLAGCGGSHRQLQHAVLESSAVSVEVADVGSISLRQQGLVAEVVQPPIANTERYQILEENEIKAVADAPVSTFSVDVDTGSYANVRRFLNAGRLPPVGAVRTEEMVNYFDYVYPQPSHGKPFAVHHTVVDSPWQPNAKLIKIAVQTHNDIDLKQLPPANLVFLVDVSGSMNADNKLPLVKKSLRLLTEQLRDEDRVAIITYASGEKMVLPPTSGQDKQAILRVINRLQASGATSGERAIQLAYEQAQKHFIEGGINRILLATDGDFNVGITDFDTLKAMVAEKRRSGVSLTTLGFGTNNYNEQLMEQLADAGDGNYSYIDNEKEAKKVLQRQLTSTLATVAQDVKVQVEFNPSTVKEYRLVGYENRTLKNEDFNNDRVDAGDIGMGHQVTAFYEIVPVGQVGWLEPSRYQNTAKMGTKKGEYAFIKLRYKMPGKDTSHLLDFPVAAKSVPWAQADAETQFAIAVASYAQALKGGKYNGAMDWQAIIDLAKKSQGQDKHGLRAEFVELAGIAQSLSSRQ